MRAKWQDIEDLLVDPVDRSRLVGSGDGSVLVSERGSTYEIRRGQPVLLPAHGFESNGWSFPPVTAADPGRPKSTSRLRPLIKAFSRLIRRGRGCQGAGDRLVDLLTTGEGTSRLLVVGGGTVGDGSSNAIDSERILTISFDIYSSAETTFVGDAHHIPLCDGSVDAVWIQAVLEHVFRPERVVSEITRVLRPNGLVYAETPFLQPVHEGAYDYERFSLSGHRLLFGEFDEIVSGPLGGPASVLNLALRGLAGGLTRSAAVARVVYLLTQPLTLLDRWIPQPWRVDFATGNYFLGRRASEVRPFVPVAQYRGAGQWQRVAADPQPGDAGPTV